MLFSTQKTAVISLMPVKVEGHYTTCINVYFPDSPTSQHAILGDTTLLNFKWGLNLLLKYEVKYYHTKQMYR